MRSSRTALPLLLLALLLPVLLPAQSATRRARSATITTRLDSLARAALAAPPGEGGGGAPTGPRVSDGAAATATNPWGGGGR